MRRLLQLTLVTAFLLSLAGPAPGRPPVAAPGLAGPPSDSTWPSLPPFAWHRVAGADHYEFQIGADPSFNSPVLGGGQDRFTTRNTFATLPRLIPSGTYWWHVRAVTKDGGVGPWSSSRSVRRSWTTAPRPLSPASSATVSYGRSTLTLSWSPVPLAAKYLVYLATDPQLSNLVGGQPQETNATSFTPSVVLAVGKDYYWAVQPEDADGIRGARSGVVSFHWSWPSTLTPQVRDLDSQNAAFFDPQLFWKPVPGAAHYDVEINPSVDFAQGSKVCCDYPVVGTSLAPTSSLKNNKYYWRVRAVDIDGDAGDWYPQPKAQPASFNKTFDNVPPVKSLSITGLHVGDNLDPTHARAAGFVTSSPVAVWEPVPGAASYQVEVAPFNTARPNDCDWTASGDHWLVNTAVPAWTPLGTGPTNPPFPATTSPTNDGPSLMASRSYCIRVRARADRSSDGAEVWGDYTYNYSPSSTPSPAFTFGGYTIGCGRCDLAARSDDYVSPVSGARVTRTPLFTWRSIPGAASYWVIVSKDRSFTTVVDYAFTREPAYAPRDGGNPRTYSDETTFYYWVVLPSGFADGAGAAGDPLRDPAVIDHANFAKRSIAPEVTASAPPGTPPTFAWKPVDGARDYRVQVSADKNFGNLLDEVVTDSVAYTATKTYPANIALYVRVRAEDENQIGLTWSQVRSFRNSLPSPHPYGNPGRGEVIPTFTWHATPRAVSYDFHAEYPDGSTHDSNNLRSPAYTPTSLPGTGVFHWQVRAEFPQAGGGTVPGPYSSLVTFTRSIRPPVGAHTVGSSRSLLFIWQAKLGARSYRLQVSRAPDFSQQVDAQEIHGTAYAPTLDSYADGGRFYWRLQAVDADGNTGDYSPTKTFTLAKLR